MNIFTFIGLLALLLLIPSFIMGFIFSSFLRRFIDPKYRKWLIARWVLSVYCAGGAALVSGLASSAISEDFAFFFSVVIFGFILFFLGTFSSLRLIFSPKIIDDKNSSLVVPESKIKDRSFGDFKTDLANRVIETFRSKSTVPVAVFSVISGAVLFVLMQTLIDDEVACSKYPGNPNQVISDYKITFSFIAVGSAIAMKMIMKVWFSIRASRVVGDWRWEILHLLGHGVYAFGSLCAIVLLFHGLFASPWLGRGWYSRPDPAFYFIISLLLASNLFLFGALNFHYYTKQLVDRGDG